MLAKWACPYACLIPNWAYQMLLCLSTEHTLMSSCSSTEHAPIFGQLTNLACSMLSCSSTEHASMLSCSPTEHALCSVAHQLSMPLCSAALQPSMPCVQLLAMPLQARQQQRERHTTWDLNLHTIIDLCHWGFKFSLIYKRSISGSIQHQEHVLLHLRIV